MQSWLEGRNWVGKGAQATGMTASLRIQSSKADSNTWESFTRSELKLESVHQESPRSDVFRKGLPSHFWTRDNVRSILPGLWRKRTGLLLSGPKSSFQMKVNFAFNLEIKVPESGGRIKRHRIHVAWSPVWSFHSQWWFGLPCHLLVLVHCVFWSPQSMQPSIRTFLEHFMLPSADKLYGDADFIFQQDLAPAHTAKGTKSWFSDHGVTVLDWPANSPDLNPIENLWVIVKRKMRDTRPNNADELKATVKETWASIPPQQCHKLITSMPRLWSILICWDSELVGFC